MFMVDFYVSLLPWLEDKRDKELQEMLKDEYPKYIDNYYFNIGTNYSFVYALPIFFTPTWYLKAILYTTELEIVFWVSGTSY